MSCSVLLAVAEKYGLHMKRTQLQYCVSKVYIFADRRGFSFELLHAPDAEIVLADVLGYCAFAAAAGGLPWGGLAQRYLFDVRDPRVRAQWKTMRKVDRKMQRFFMPADYAALRGVGKPVGVLAELFIEKPHIYSHA